MTNSIDYRPISLVLDSWELLKQLDNYDQVASTILFKDLFANSVHAKILFGYKEDADVNTPTIMHSRAFKQHAVKFIDMIDTAVGMLGPDMDTATEIMVDLGVKHRKFGVNAELYPVMGKALFHTLDVVLEDRINDETRQAWQQIYALLTTHMLQAYE